MDTKASLPMSNALLRNLIASLALPDTPLLRAFCVVATLCVLYVCGQSFRTFELGTYMPEHATWLTCASLL
eukprot:63959-Pleurochrysis_carterae.AAC.3